MSAHIYHVAAIENKVTYPYLLDIHYAKRIPSISYAFGLFRDNLLVGVVTYGTPSSAALRKGVAGIENAHRVLELNRLCLLDNLKNEASILVGNSLSMLPKGLFIVSYADSSQDHLGYVYQATNFIYTGLSAKRTDWKIEGLEHLHNATIVDQFRGHPNRAQAVREMYGDRFKLVDRPRKHRYIFITGTPKMKKALAKHLKYAVQSYPKPITESA